jgi:NAD(P)-dependent dehydrogenase (short-subunit alcohol dehydrogenase family)
MIKFPKSGRKESIQSLGKMEEIMKLAGKVALITGAGSGIGKGISLLFAEEGADISVNDIDLTAAEKTASEVRKTGRRAIAIKADVAEATEVEAMVSRTIEELGGIHILVNSAGFSSGGTVLDEDLENWDRNIDVMLRGTYLCSKYAGHWMVKHKTGKVINISSIVAVGGIPGMGAYIVAKAGVNALTRVLAMEWSKLGINVNCISPGVIDTPMTQKTIAKRFTPERLAETIPLGRMGTAEDIAKAALFLASDDSSFITGANIPLDGGMLNTGVPL